MEDNIYRSADIIHTGRGVPQPQQIPLESYACCIESCFDGSKAFPARAGLRRAAGWKGEPQGLTLLPRSSSLRQPSRPPVLEPLPALDEDSRLPFATARCAEAAAAASAAQLESDEVDARRQRAVDTPRIMTRAPGCRFL